jgi:hypothetical protein
VCWANTHASAVLEYPASLLVGREHPDKNPPDKDAVSGPKMFYYDPETGFL